MHAPMNLVQHIWRYAFVSSVMTSPKLAVETHYQCEVVDGESFALHIFVSSQCDHSKLFLMCARPQHKSQDVGEQDVDGASFQYARASTFQLPACERLQVPWLLARCVSREVYMRLRLSAASIQSRNALQTTANKLTTGTRTHLLT